MQQRLERRPLEERQRFTLQRVLAPMDVILEPHQKLEVALVL